MQNIITELQNFGLSTGELITDGRIHRCNSSAKNKRNKDGWYGISEFNGDYYCNYGCWVRGEQGKCSTLNGSGSDYDQSVWKKLEAERLKDEEARRVESRLKASKFISKCSPSDGKHPYLEKKQIKPCGCLRNGKFMVIPVYDESGQISSYQTIDSQGVKKFMPGGTVGGCCFPIQGVETTICICEGFATGASIHDATGYKVLVAFNAGNLEKIAKAAIKKFQGSDIIICADNDHTKEKNVGLETGKAVAGYFGLSCVWPTNIQGSDFNDMFCELGINAVRQEICQKETIEVLSAEDCIGVDGSLQIPDAAIPKGLISQGVDALEGDIIQFSLPLILTTISRAIAGKISLNNVHPNVFNIKVGGTSTGKTAMDRRFLRCLDIDGFVSLNDIASGPGLWRAVAENPIGMGLFDEVTSLFQRGNAKGGVDMIAEGKAHALLDLFSRSGESFKKGFGDAKNQLIIHNPCFSLLGNATPTIFDAIQLKDFETGLMQRFDFWVYDGVIKPKTLLINSNYYAKTKAYIEELRKIIQFTPPDATLASLIKGCVELKATKEAIVYIQEYSDYVTEEANKQQSEGMTGFMSRRFDLSLKYALVHHAASRAIEDLLSEIDALDIQYGILIAEMLGGWKSNVLSNRVVSGDFHRDCETFKSAIKAAVISGRANPTFTYLAQRKTHLKNWIPKYSESIINVLKKRGEIITKEGPKSTQYYLPKVGAK